ncbi:MAG TPA: phosphotransferase [Nocardioidaceae bacterium]|nr:phosphotransferase [Nocardioidaceae bacterium]
MDGLGFEDGGGVLPELVPLAGGHSGETFLARSAGERSVVRIYAGRGATRGPNAAETDAAVLRLVRGLVPVPEVLEVRRADDSAGTPALLVTSWLEGTRLDEVLPSADDTLAETIGRNLGRILARLAQMPMLRAGMFLDGELRIGPWPAGADDLTEWVATYGRAGPLGEWNEDDRAALEALAEKAQEVVDRTDRACLVHSDFNPKNVLVDPSTGEVTGLLDWEFAHAGSPFTDLGNLLRFEHRPVFSGAVLSTYSDLVVDAPEDLLDRARAADLFALVELASRAEQTPVAIAAEDLLRTIVRHGYPE